MRITYLKKTLCKCQIDKLLSLTIFNYLWVLTPKKVFALKKKK